MSSSQMSIPHSDKCTPPARYSAGILCVISGCLTIEPPREDTKRDAPLQTFRLAKSTLSVAAAPLH